MSDHKLEEVASSASDAVQSCSTPSASPHRPEPVCYSVEAVLGAQLSKPFANYLSTPNMQGSDTLSSPGYTSGKSVENSTLNSPPSSPVAQSASYVPVSQSYRSLNSAIQNQKVSASVNVVSRSRESSLNSTPGLDSLICPSLTAASGDQKKQVGNMPESLPTAPRAPRDVPVHIPRDISCVNSQRQSCPSSGSTAVRHKVALTADPVSTPSCHSSKAKQPSDIGKKLPASEGDTKHFSSGTVAESSSKMARCEESAVVCKKPLEIPFRSLFAAPIADMLPPLDSSRTCSVSQSADSRRTPPKTAPDKAPTRPFLSLFSAPLTAAPLPHLKPQPDNTSTASCSQQPAVRATDFSTSKQKTDSEAALPPQLVSEVSHEPEPNFPPNPVVEPGADEQQRPESPSHKRKEVPHGACGHECEMLIIANKCFVDDHVGSAAAAATANSVLKTLFLRLSPFREDEEIGGASGTVLSETVNIEVFHMKLMSNLSLF